MLAAACSPAPPVPTVVPTSPPPIAPTTAPTNAAPTTVPTLAPIAIPTAVTTLKIGVLVPYTESSIGVDIGLDQKRAADLYLKRQGGKLGGRPITLVYSAESVESGINKVKVRTLMESDKVGLLLGAAAAETAYVMREAADAAKMVFLDTSATANALTRSIPDCRPSCKSPYLFRTSATSWQLSQPLGEWAAGAGLTEFYVNYVDDAFGAESADAFVSGLGKNGGKATERQALLSGGDWAKAIRAINEQPSQHVFAAFHTDDAEGFLGEWQRQRMAEAGYKLYGPGFLADTEVLVQAKSAADGVVTTHFWSTELSNSENKALVGMFGQEYTDEDTGEPVTLSGYAVAMWDAMTALDDALKHTGGDTGDTDSLIGALENASFKSPRGTFAFDKSTHNPVQDILIRQAKPVNGKLVNAIIDTVPHVADPGT